MYVKVSLMTKKLLKATGWLPSQPISKGASAYHDAVVNTSWHIDNIRGLIDLVRKFIKDGDEVIDFGAGTGASAIYLLKELKSKYNLWLVDNSPSWLGKAWEILHHKRKVSFLVLGRNQRG